MRVRPQPLLLPAQDGRLTGREWLVLGLGALVLAVWLVVTEPGLFGSTDWVRMHSEYKGYAQLSVAQGRLPLWNPYHWLGRPFLADIESAFFYPPEWLYLLIDIHVACALTCALHLLLLLYGALKLSRALGADRLPSFFVAFVLSASAPMAGCFSSGLLHYGQALCYLPWVLYLGMRVQAGPQLRDVALLALTLGLQILCGHPQATWLTEIGLVVFLLGRRLERPVRVSLAGVAWDAGAVAGALVLGLALAGVALLPFAELAKQGNRPEASVAFAGLFAEPWFGWATLVVPTESPYFAFQANAQLYAGVLPLIAGLCGLVLLRERNARALGLLALFAALLAAGNATPFFRLFFHVIPGLGWLRIHSRATVLITLAVVLAAGLFLSREHSRRTVALVLVAALVAGSGAALFYFAWPDFGPVAGNRALARGLVAGLAGVGLFVWLRTPVSRRQRKAMISAGLVVLTVFDLGLAGRQLARQNRAARCGDFADNFKAALVEQGFLAEGQPPPRVFVPGPCENSGMTRGWSSAQGYSALAFGRVWRHLHEVLGVPIPFGANTFPSPQLAAMGPFPYPSLAMAISIDPRTHKILVNPHPDPRVYLASAERKVGDDREATALMRQGHDFHTIALVEKASGLPQKQAPITGKAAITHFAPERIAVTVDSSVEAWLVLAEPWFPGWSAEVNGQPTSSVPVNAWMRAVRIPAGRSEVTFRFRSTYLAPGAALSLAALAVILVLLARRRRGSSNKPDSADTPDDSRGTLPA